MQTYEFFQNHRFTGGTVAGQIRYTIAEDAKRPGMYKSTMAYSIDGFKMNYSHLYGKKNQGEIQNMIATGCANAKPF